MAAGREEDKAEDMARTYPFAAIRGHKADCDQAAWAACMQGSYIDGSPWL